MRRSRANSYNMKLMNKLPSGFKEEDDAEHDHEPVENLSFHNLSEEQLESYVKYANDAWDVIRFWLKSIQTWTLEAGHNPIDGCVKSRRFEKYGKVMLLQARLNMKPPLLYEDLAFNVKDQPNWNPLVSNFQILEKLPDGIDVMYYMVPGVIRGLIKDRDFIVVRRCGIMNGMYVQSVYGATHPGKPPQRKIVRGDNGPGGWILKAVPNDSNKSDFSWFSCLKMKGMLPQNLIDQLSPPVMLDYLKPLRKHIENLVGEQTKEEEPASSQQNTN